MVLTTRTKHQVQHQPHLCLCLSEAEPSPTSQPTEKKRVPLNGGNGLLPLDKIANRFQGGKVSLCYRILLQLLAKVHPKSIHLKDAKTEFTTTQDAILFSVPMSEFEGPEQQLLGGGSRDNRPDRPDSRMDSVSTLSNKDGGENGENGEKAETKAEQDKMTPAEQCLSDYWGIYDELLCKYSVWDCGNTLGIDFSLVEHNSNTIDSKSEEKEIEKDEKEIEVIKNQLVELRLQVRMACNPSFTLVLGGRSSESAYAAYCVDSQVYSTVTDVLLNAVSFQSTLKDAWTKSASLFDPEPVKKISKNFPNENVHDDSFSSQTAISNGLPSAISAAAAIKLSRNSLDLASVIDLIQVFPCRSPEKDREFDFLKLWTHLDPLKRSLDLPSVAFSNVPKRKFAALLGQLAEDTNVEIKGHLEGIKSLTASARLSNPNLEHIRRVRSRSRENCVLRETKEILCNGFSFKKPEICPDTHAVQVRTIEDHADKHGLRKRRQILRGLKRKGKKQRRSLIYSTIDEEGTEYAEEHSTEETPSDPSDSEVEEFFQTVLLELVPYTFASEEIVNFEDVAAEQRERTAKLGFSTVVEEIVSTNPLDVDKSFIDTRIGGRSRFAPFRSARSPQTSVSVGSSNINRNTRNSNSPLTTNSLQTSAIPSQTNRSPRSVNTGNRFSSRFSNRFPINSSNMSPARLPPVSLPFSTRSFYGREGEVPPPSASSSSSSSSSASTAVSGSSSSSSSSSSTSSTGTMTPEEALAAGLLSPEDAALVAGPTTTNTDTTTLDPRIPPPEVC